MKNPNEALVTEILANAAPAKTRNLYAAEILGVLTTTKQLDDLLSVTLNLNTQVSVDLDKPDSETLFATIDMLSDTDRRNDRENHNPGFWSAWGVFCDHYFHPRHQPTKNEKRQARRRAKRAAAKAAQA